VIDFRQTRLKRKLVIVVVAMAVVSMIFMTVFGMIFMIVFLVCLMAVPAMTTMQLLFD
jgi:hypothetical protein